jgi:hypothetical protein
MEIDDSNLEIGDILLCKTKSFIGRSISWSFHEDSPISDLWQDDRKYKPSNHNGWVGVDGENNLVIFESLFKGLVATDINEYKSLVQQNKCSVMFVRLSGLTREQKIELNHFGCDNVGILKYDFLSYIYHIWSTMLRLPPIFYIHSKRDFWCTEIVQFVFDTIGKDVFEKKMPTPFTVEKRVKSKLLDFVTEWHYEKDL